MARDAQRPVRAWIGVYIALTKQVATASYGPLKKRRSILLSTRADLHVHMV